MMVYLTIGDWSYNSQVWMLFYDLSFWFMSHVAGLLHLLFNWSLMHICRVWDTRGYPKPARARVWSQNCTRGGCGFLNGCGFILSGAGLGLRYPSGLHPLPSLVSIPWTAGRCPATEIEEMQQESLEQPSRQAGHASHNLVVLECVGTLWGSAHSSPWICDHSVPSYSL